jgi:hypothetical protein
MSFPKPDLKKAHKARDRQAALPGACAPQNRAFGTANPFRIVPSALPILVRPHAS